jgi:hypothetical protein
MLFDVQKMKAHSLAGGSLAQVKFGIWTEKAAFHVCIGPVGRGRRVGWEKKNHAESHRTQDGERALGLLRAMRLCVKSFSGRIYPFAGRVFATREIRNEGQEENED